MNLEPMNMKPLEVKEKKNCNIVNKHIGIKMWKKYKVYLSMYINVCDINVL